MRRASSLPAWTAWRALAPVTAWSKDDAATAEKKADVTEQPAQEAVAAAAVTKHQSTLVGFIRASDRL